MTTEEFPTFQLAAEAKWQFAILSVLLLFACHRKDLPVPSLNGSNPMPPLSMHSNESMAIYCLRVIGTAEMVYIEKNQRFGTAEELFEADLIGETLANGAGCRAMKSSHGKICAGNGDSILGYKFRITPLAQDYTAIATPTVTEGLLKTGAMSFYTDGSSTIRGSNDLQHDPDAHSPPLEEGAYGGLPPGVKDTNLDASIKAYSGQ